MTGAWTRRSRGNFSRLGGWRWAAESAGMGLVLLALVSFAVVGAGWMFAATVVSAWFLMLALLPPEDALDAGLVFMLVALGIAVSVGLAHEGLGAIFFPR